MHARAGCLLLANYSQLCMDGNNSNTLQCTPWASMCASNPTLYLCKVSSTFSLLSRALKA